MNNDETRGSTRRSTLLPATLLLILVTAIGGAVLWLALTPPPQPGDLPKAQFELAPSSATVRPTEPAQRGDAPPAGDPAASPAVPDSPGPAEAAEPPVEQPASDPTPVEVPPAEPRRDGASGEHPDQGVVPAPPASPPPSPPEEPSRDGAGAQPYGDTAQPEVAALPPMLADLPPAPPSPPLPKAPDPALVEETAKGLLPIIGRDGREAWRVYARPFDRGDSRPKIAVVLYGLGSSDAATRSAIQGLPGPVTLAFTPYADELPGWIADARAAGHEVLLMVPMEPVNYPSFDPGPQALLTSLDGKQNTDRLEWMLGRAVGYVGVTDFMGSRFTSSAPHMRDLLENLRKRGLMFLESRPGARAVAAEIAAVTHVPFAANTLYIDTKASRSAIDAQLLEAERLARKFGEVVAMGFLYPVTLERVARWSNSVEQRGVALAPVSALAKRKESQ